MRKMLLLAGCLASFGTATLVVRAASEQPGLVVHEWGTFLAMNGSDGVTLDGMYHEEHALPAFVHARRHNELKLRGSNLKGETPVIYFYSDMPRQVSVEVGFPGGLWTQWYPQASFVGPTFMQTGSLPHARNGRIGWTVNLIPPKQANATLPAAPKDALWNYARDVDASLVYLQKGTGSAQTKEWERFIFYRGLGEARLPLAVSATGGARLTCGAELSEGLRDVYLLRVEHGQGVYRHLPALNCGERIEQVVPAMEGAQPVAQFAETIANDLAARLEKNGLYAKEARAMVNTWRTSYFTTDGTRVLFILPQSWTDRFIPMQIRPTPDELVRVMVGRIEVLTPAREREAEDAISRLAAPDPETREAAFTFLREQGRYVEPIVRRTLQSTSDTRVRVLAERLLLTDFVTDLRTSLTDAADGRELVTEPAYARAQLASLLRDIGFPEEARQEGERARAALATMKPPTLSDHTSRNTFRALARASEGAGREADALAWYSVLITFGSSYKTCQGCHALGGPTNDAFFRDWWAGRRFAEVAKRTGELPRLIQAEEAALAKRSDNFVAQLRLAYLYDARGDTARAARLWNRIDPQGDARASR